MPGNPARGLDAHQGLVTLFDGDIGVPTAVLDASAVTEIRTAAVTAVATRALAREDVGVLAILGAGVQARAHLDALSRVREFDGSASTRRTEAHTRALVAAAAGDGLPELTVAPSAEEAVRGADVVVVATSSREPVLERDWLAPGAHVNAVGASSPTRPRARRRDGRRRARCSATAASRCETRRASSGWRSRRGDRRARSTSAAELGEVLAGTRPGRSDDRRADAVPLARARRRGPGRGRARGRARARATGARDRGRAVIALARDRGGARADRRRRGSHAARPPADVDDAPAEI